MRSQEAEPQLCNAVMALSPDLYFQRNSLKDNGQAVSLKCSSRNQAFCDNVLTLLSMTETKVIELIIRKSVVEHVLSITFHQINTNY